MNNYSQYDICNNKNHYWSRGMESSAGMDNGRK